MTCTGAAALGVCSAAFDLGDGRGEDHLVAKVYGDRLAEQLDRRGTGGL